MLFLPAWDEEQVVGDVVARAPRQVLGLPVDCLVIDDGSSDATAERAAAAGAEVVGLGAHRGLGAAVRRGLEEGVRRGAAAVAFCDADGEYAPEELERLVRPVLDGTADYVIGSRFAGAPRRMAPHRWLGNRILTVALGAVLGRRVSDGQSGYRALSPAAAADAEIIHDFNYAQVLTLDLLTKGYRYAEVPISYRFRTTGRSFVRPAGYLAQVLPAVVRQRRVQLARARVVRRSPAGGRAVRPPAPGFAPLRVDASTPTITSPAVPRAGALPGGVHRAGLRAGLRTGPGASAGRAPRH